VVAEAAWHVVTRDSRATTGRFFLDEEVLAEAGVTDLTRYAVDPAVEPMSDLFVD
jgi:citronellol/citronellal dehydrogenase